MAIKCFVYALREAKEPTRSELERMAHPERIPGSKKIRTFAWEDFIYSEESEMENILDRERRARGEEV